jgi:succinate dehydrogenase/fumarate reductase flavoprotein subunit
MSNAKVIIVGGGLSGLSAAHTVLERGGNVVCPSTIHLGEAKADI